MILQEKTGRFTKLTTFLKNGTQNLTVNEFDVKKVVSTIRLLLEACFGFDWQRRKAEISQLDEGGENRLIGTTWKRGSRMRFQYK